MSRRFLVLPAILVLAALLVPAALGAAVRVRVEGKTATIFGTAEPRAQATTALDALEAASLAGEFYYHVQVSSFGRYVDQVGRYAAEGQTGWVFKVNGVSPPVGADQVQLKDGDVVLWYWAQFGVAGGPRTLHLTSQGRSCYQAVSRDDNGVAQPAAGATLVVDSRRVRTNAGRACVGPHRGLVRAVLAGAVRSNAVR